MKLKAGNVKKYGLPYQGSKSKIIDQIAKFFPNAHNFYDLFGGGFSVSHYMIENRKSSYKKFHFNELRSGICQLVQDSISGKYNYDVFKPEWITREKFNAEKETNAYIKICWSFGNNGKSYLFGKDIENQKRSMHQAVVFNEFDQFMKETFKIDKWPNALTITGKRLYLKRLSNQRIELQQLERLSFTSVDYKNVKIEKSSVIYCDIPYFGTADYGNSFNHTKFFDWASKQENPVFISEYEVKDKRFHLLKEFKHRSSFNNKTNIPVIERLYGNKIAYDIINKHKEAKNG